MSNDSKNLSATSPPNNSAPIRIALVEDDVNFQNALTLTIRHASDMTLLAVSGTRANGLQMLDQVVADVLLVDLGLPDGSGIDVIRAANEKWPDCNIMVCSTFADEKKVILSLEAGATGYLLKDSMPKDILDEIRSLHGGGSPISPLIARQILTRFRHEEKAAETATPADNTPLLSAREQQVLEYTTKGFTSSEIAKLMSISHHTVLTYVRRIYAKLKVNSKAEAIYEARNQGLLAK